MLKWLLAKWHARQRALDIQTLWPSICELAPTEQIARDRMLVHAAIDPAWEDLDFAEAKRRIRELPYPPEALS